MRHARIHGCKLAIGFCGAARHGKDSAAKALLMQLPGAERFALSDIVATDCRVHHGMVKRNPRLMQTVGTDRRQGNPYIWIDALYGLIQDREPSIVLVTGLRYPEEVEFVRALAPRTAILRIRRLTAAGTPYVADDRDPHHPVEQGIEALQADAELTATSGDLAGLTRSVVAWLPNVAM